MPEPRCLIDLRCEHPSPPPLDRAVLAAAIERALADDDRRGCALTLLVVDDATAGALHGEHFGDPETTDVMTFPDGSTDPESGREHLGDVAICADVARRVAAERAGGRDPEAVAAEECVLYAVHGLLHLLGYDDVDPADRRAMWDRQRETLAAVGITIEAQPDGDEG